MSDSANRMPTIAPITAALEELESAGNAIAGCVCLHAVTRAFHVKRPLLSWLITSLHSNGQRTIKLKLSITNAHLRVYFAARNMLPCIVQVIRGRHERQRADNSAYCAGNLFALNRHTSARGRQRAVRSGSNSWLLREGLVRKPAQQPVRAHQHARDKLRVGRQPRIDGRLGCLPSASGLPAVPGVPVCRDSNLRGPHWLHAQKYIQFAGDDTSSKGSMRTQSFLPQTRPSAYFIRTPLTLSYLEVVGH